MILIDNCGIGRHTKLQQLRDAVPQLQAGRTSHWSTGLHRRIPTSGMTCRSNTDDISWAVLDHSAAGVPR